MAENALVAANARFAFRLFAELAGQDPNANVFISPASIVLALAMAYNGASGATGQAMARALAFGDLRLDQINQASAQLRESLEQRSPGVALAIANSLWARRGVPFSAEFLRRNAEFYGSEIAELDFADPQAAAQINAWVRRQTHDKIDKIIDRLEPGAVLFLLNAIYFKGDWARPFDRALTRPEPFTTAGGQQRPHPLMTQTGRYRYLESQDMQAVGLPYVGARLSMYFFLPAPRSDVARMARALSDTSWESWMSRFRDTEGSVSIPRFRLKYDIRLNQALQALGMGPAFDSQRADFSAMLAPGSGAPRIWIDEVKHKTYIDVNEEGAEAAAVTGVGMRMASFAPVRTFRMVVDRPFFCAIADDQSGLILFMGRVSDPQNE